MDRTIPTEVVWARALTVDVLADHLTAVARDVRTFAPAQRAALLLEARRRLTMAGPPDWPVWETSCGCTLTGQHIPEGDGVAEPYGDCAACGAKPLAD